MSNHRHSDTAKPTMPRLDDLVGTGNGLFVIPAVIDREAGAEEVVIFLRDTEPQIGKLLKTTFQLNIRPGVHRNFFGPVGHILFWLSPLDDTDAVLWSCVKHFDPHSKEMALWQRLADQDHWHLFLVVGNELRDFMFYGTNFRLDEGLATIRAASAECRTVDHAKAVALCKDQLSVEFLLSAPNGTIPHVKVLRKSEMESILGMKL